MVLVYVYIYPSIYLSIYLSICLSIYLFIYLSIAIPLFIRISIYIYTHVSGITNFIVQTKEVWASLWSQFVWDCTRDYSGGVEVYALICVFYLISGGLITCQAIPQKRLHQCVYVDIYTYIYIDVCNAYIPMHIYIYVCVCRFAHVCTFICVSAYSCTCVFPRGS